MNVNRKNGKNQTEMNFTVIENKDYGPESTPITFMKCGHPECEYVTPEIRHRSRNEYGKALIQLIWHWEDNHA